MTELHSILAKLPPSRPADWKAWNVTVCIALLSEYRKKIVCVTDARASFRDFSAEKLAQKNILFFDDWAALYAGNDIEYVTPILERTTGKLYELMKKKRRRPTVEEIGNTLQRAWWAQLDELIECQVLRRHKVTAAEFLADGKSLFTDTIYNGLRNRMEQVKLSLQFLACGFDSNGDGHILFIDGITPPGSHDPTGMYAIGTGANAALSALAFQNGKNSLSLYSDLAQSVYCALEARFMATSAKDVGRESTFVTILEKDRAVKFISDPGVAYLRKLWQRSGAPRIPKRALDVIPSLLYGMNTPEPGEESIGRIEAIIGKPGLIKRSKARAEKRQE